MTAACRPVAPSTLNFCYVIDSSGTAPTDQAQCEAASGIWRPNHSCCNFKGDASCPD